MPRRLQVKAGVDVRPGAPNRVDIVVPAIAMSTCPPIIRRERQPRVRRPLPLPHRPSRLLRRSELLRLEPCPKCLPNLKARVRRPLHELCRLEPGRNCLPRLMLRSRQLNHDIDAEAPWSSYRPVLRPRFRRPGRSVEAPSVTYIRQAHPCLPQSRRPRRAPNTADDLPWICIPQQPVALLLLRLLLLQVVQHVQDLNGEVLSGCILPLRQPLHLHLRQVVDVHDAAAPWISSRPRRRLHPWRLPYQNQPLVVLVLVVA